ARCSAVPHLARSTGEGPVSSPPLLAASWSRRGGPGPRLCLAYALHYLFVEPTGLWGGFSKETSPCDDVTNFPRASGSGLPLCCPTPPTRVAEDTPGIPTGHWPTPSSGSATPAPPGATSPSATAPGKRPTTAS